MNATQTVQAIASRHVSAPARAVFDAFLDPDLVKRGWPCRLHQVSSGSSGFLSTGTRAAHFRSSMPSMARNDMLASTGRSSARIDCVHLVASQEPPMMSAWSRSISCR